jgi:hypothetical protein
MEQVQPGKREDGGAGISTALADLKLKIAEHLISQADNYRPDEVYGIMAETKIGARERTQLVEKLRMVFSVS